MVLDLEEFFEDRELIFVESWERKVGGGSDGNSEGEGSVSRRSGCAEQAKRVDRADGWRVVV